MLLRHVTAAGLFSLVLIAHADPTIVKTRPLGDVLIEKTYTAPATAVAINNSQISAEIAARIRSIDVQVGDIVDAGDTLARLDCRSYQNSLDSTVAESESLQVQVQLAERQLKRAKSLRAKNNLSAEVLDQRVADLDIARANAKRQRAAINDAKLSVERCAVTAPYRAAVTSRLAGEGTMATAGLPLLEIVGLNAVELSVQVPVELVDSLVASRALLFVSNGDKQTAEVRVVSPVINAAAGNREVRLTTQKALTPGSNGRLQWYSPPLLPANLLTRRDNALGVFITETNSGTKSARFVALDGALEGRPAAVDLPSDAQVIIQGRHTLSAGDEITISE